MTDDQVGSAIRDSGVPRREIFLTTKFWPQWGAPENVEQCLDVCLANMGLDYVDLYLAHWPMVLKATSDLKYARATPEASNEERGIAVDENGKCLIDWQHTTKSISTANKKSGNFQATWEAMQRTVTSGKTRAIGVSNFNIQQLQEVASIGGPVPLSCNQVEAHPRFLNKELLEFMEANKILSAVYCPFAGQGTNESVPLLKDPRVAHVASRNKMDVGQLLLSWAIQRGTIPIGKSQTPGQSSFVARFDHY